MSNYLGYTYDTSYKIEINKIIKRLFIMQNILNIQNLLSFRF